MISLVDLLNEVLSKEFQFPTFDYLNDEEKYYVEGLVLDFLDNIDRDEYVLKSLTARIVRKIRDSGKELYGGENPFHDVTRVDMKQVVEEPITLEFIKDFLIQYPDFIGAYASSDFFNDEDFSKKLREILVGWISNKKPGASNLYKKLQDDVDRAIIMHVLDANINK